MMMKTILACTSFFTIFILSYCSRYGSLQGAVHFDPDRFNARNFTFTAKSVIPMRGTVRILTSPYDVQVKNDSLIAYLPYYGVSQSAPGNSDEAGIRFNSTSFSVNSKKLLDGWEVTIDVRDQKFVNSFVFTIFRNGAASLDVTSSFRDFISFKGEVVNN